MAEPSAAPLLVLLVRRRRAPRPHTAPPSSGATPLRPHLTFTYISHDGREPARLRRAPVLVRPRRRIPPIPVVISPHGRNANGLSNSKYFGNLPAVGKFAVISPDGMGRKDTYKSYGYKGQIDDLARMPELAEAAFPWLRLDHDRVYALGSSMGGQETALLVAQHPELLAGAAAMDSVTDLTRRYGQLLTVPCDRKCLKKWGKPYGYILQAAMRREVGGSPTENPARVRAPQPAQPGAGDRALRRARSRSGGARRTRSSSTSSTSPARLFQTRPQSSTPCAPVSAYEGRWKHSSRDARHRAAPDRARRLRPASGRHEGAAAHGPLRAPAPSCEL